MSTNGQSIRQWLEEFTGDLHEPNRWRLYAKFEESPKLFPLMVLRFLDEFSSCFNMSVEYDVDVLSIDSDRQADLDELLQAAEFLHDAWLECQHLSAMKTFPGSIVDSLRTATLEFIKEGPEWIIDDCGPFSNVEVRGNCGEKIEELRWKLWQECQRNWKSENVVRDTSAGFETIPPDPMAYLAKLFGTSAAETTGQPINCVTQESLSTSAAETTDESTDSVTDELRRTLAAKKSGEPTDEDRRKVSEAIKSLANSTSGAYPKFHAIRKKAGISSGKLSLIMNEFRQQGQWATPKRGKVRKNPDSE